MSEWAVGDRVEIRDDSEAHGDHGVIWQVGPTVVAVELDEGGCIWPVMPHEIARLRTTHSTSTDTEAP